MNGPHQLDIFRTHVQCYTSLPYFQLAPNHELRSTSRYKFLPEVKFPLLSGSIPKNLIKFTILAPIQCP